MTREELKAAAELVKERATYSRDQYEQAGLLVPETGLKRLVDSQIAIAEHVLAQLAATSPTAHEIKKRFLQFISYAVTVKPRDTQDWLAGFVQEANSAAAFLGYSGRFVQRGDSIQWSEDR